MRLASLSENENFTKSIFYFIFFFQCSKFAQSVCALVHQVCRFVSCTTQTKVIEEWQEFFASSIFPVLLSLFVDIAANLQISNEEKEPLLCNLGKIYTK